MQQTKLFGGFTKPVADSAPMDGVQMLTAQHQRITSEKLRLTEQQVTAQIVEWMQWRGWTAHRKHVGEFIAFAKVMEWLGNLLDAMRKGGLTAVRDCAMKAMRDFPHSKVTLGKAGLPDWCFTHPKIHPAVYIEMKATGKKPEPLQLATLDQLRRDGYHATWVDGFDMFHAWYQTNIIRMPAQASVEKTA